MGMRTGNMMGDAYLGKEGISFSCSPNTLHGKDLTMKEALNMGLKFLKFLENFIFVFNKIDASEFAKIINETHIVFKPMNRFRHRAPYI
jgi:hypothetical protein